MGRRRRSCQRLSDIGCTLGSPVSEWWLQEPACIICTAGRWTGAVVGPGREGFPMDLSVTALSLTCFLCVLTTYMACKRAM
jgi:hypothetical protein